MCFPVENVNQMWTGSVPVAFWRVMFLLFLHPSVMGNGASEMTPKEIKDLAARSHLTEEEIKKLKGGLIDFGSCFLLC